MVYTAGAAWLGVTAGVTPPVRRIALGRLRGCEVSAVNACALVVGE